MHRVALQRRPWSVGAVLAVILGFTSGACTQVFAQAVNDFIVPTVGSQPFGITLGPDGALWFTEFSGNKIGRITTAGVMTEFSVPTGNSQPFSITAGPDGALWFVEVAGNKIGRIATNGTIVEFPVPLTAGGAPNPGGLAVGADGALWFTEITGNMIGRITITGAITKFAIPTANSLSHRMASGPDGALWFAEAGGNKIGRITTSGVISEFALPNAGTPFDIVSGADGALWFTEISGNKIGRITTAGTISEFPVPTAASQPALIAAGPDGAVWFSEAVGNKVGRIGANGAITEFPVPTTNSQPQGVARGPDGAVWFAETNGNKIGRISPPASASPLVAATLPSSRSVQVGGNVATAFAVILNAGAAATQCGIAPVTPVPASFLFQTTDPGTNALTGSPNTRVSIPAGAAQTFLVAFTANAPLVPTDVQLGFACANVEATSTIVGVNTLLLTFDASPVADMIAVGLTPSRDGYSRTGGPTGTGIFVIASTDIGAGASLTARVRPLDPSMPLNATLCETTPNGNCKAAPAATVTRTINQNENTTWTAFLTAAGTIAQDAARNRVFFEFVDGSGVVRGSTSTAVTTQ